jgi:acyl carrier protein
MQDSNVETIVDLVVRILMLDHPPAPDASLGDLGMDSTAVVSLFMALEEQLDIRFQDDDLTAENFQSVSKIVDAVARAQAAN